MTDPVTTSETMHRIAPNLIDLAVPIGSVIPYPGNARVHADATLAESLQVNQQYRPLVVQTSTNYVLAGNGTWKAALALGWTHVAVTKIDCDDATARRIVLVDNRASDLATYDDTALRAILAEVSDPVGTGYSPDELSALLSQLDPTPATPEQAPRPVGPTVDVGETVKIIQGDARKLDLADHSVDLIVTSPPYWGLRSYQDDGSHYEGQIGSEETPEQWLAVMWECTREWMRVLKPTGSLWVNLGDKYAGSDASSDWNTAPLQGCRGRLPELHVSQQAAPRITTMVKTKSLVGLPWRYAIGCIDKLGLTLRAEVIWHKSNGLPESVTDRVCRSHEQVFHFTVQPQYYSAVDEIREPYAQLTAERYASGYRNGSKLSRVPDRSPDGGPQSPPGKLPGSVWEIPTQKLIVPDGMPDHFAAFPVALPLRIIQGWSPAGICVTCGEGRRPVVDTGYINVRDHGPRNDKRSELDSEQNRLRHFRGGLHANAVVQPIGHVCACTPYTDHPGTGESSGPTYSDAVAAGAYPNTGQDWGGKQDLAARPRTGPRREYHLADWNAPATTPAVVLDPFGGTGTTAMVASVLGRIGISVDASKDYCELARWRTADAGERAKVLRKLEDITPDEVTPDQSG